MDREFGYFYWVEDVIMNVLNLRYLRRFCKFFSSVVLRLGYVGVGVGYVGRREEEEIFRREKWKYV